MRTISLAQLFVVVAFALLIDRAMKYVALEYSYDNKLYSLFVNSYGVFSIPVSNGWMMVVSGIIILSLIITSAIFFIRNKKVSIAMAVLIIGALSNFYDRVAYGGVIDFLRIGHASVINLSDVYIITALIVMILGVDRYYVLR